MKSRMLIALLSLGLGLNVALLVVTVVKLERVERRVMAGSDEERGRGASMLFGLPRIDPEELDLTPEQHEKIRRLREQWHEEEAGRRRAFIDRRQTIPELFESEDVSMEQMMPLLDQAHEASKERLASVIRLYHEYQTILTPEQQERFKELVREQHEHHHKRWERFKERNRRHRRGEDERWSRKHNDDRSGRHGGDGGERWRSETDFNPVDEIDTQRMERFREERRRRAELRDGAERAGEVTPTPANEDLMPPMPGEAPPLEPGPAS